MRAAYIFGLVDLSCGISVLYGFPTVTDNALITMSKEIVNLQNIIKPCWGCPLIPTTGKYNFALVPASLTRT